MHLPGKPQGNPGNIHHAADAWNTAARTIETAERDIASVIRGQMCDWEGSSRHSFDLEAKKMTDAMEELASSFRKLSGRLDHFADKLHDSQNKYNIAVAAAGVTAVVGIGLTVFTFGGSDAAAGAAVAAEVGGAVEIATGAAAVLTTEVGALALADAAFPVVATETAVAATTSGVALVETAGLDVAAAASEEEAAIGGASEAGELGVENGRPIDLDEHEVGRGHTLEKHVDLSDEDFLDRLNDYPEASRFFDRGVAELGIEKTIGANLPEIEEWLSSPTPRLPIEFDVGEEIGEIISRNSNAVLLSSLVRVVLIPNEAFEFGWQILTGMVF
ncbi:RNase A-like domain-containing protein [Aquihabitans sp. McL0605]|uniref:RNase A-like domain-containing protein n=1 Tax=Aquihabitans sp. McL0605 TaxID=3415671 RepID=UPI003CEA8889